MSEDQETEWLEKYLSGELSESEAMQLEQRLKDDPALKKKLEDLSLLIQGIKKTGRKDLQRYLKTIESELPAVERATVPLWQNTWMRVAAVFAIVATGYLFWPRPADPQQLFNDYFEPYPNVVAPLLRGEVETDSSLQARAYGAYERGDYTQAIWLFEKIEKKDEGVLLYLGNSYMGANDAKSAIPVLEKLIVEYDKFDEQAEWYLALAYLKESKTEKAQNLLKKIIQQNRDQQKKANEILLNLN